MFNHVYWCCPEKSFLGGQLVPLGEKARLDYRLTRKVRKMTICKLSDSQLYVHHSKNKVTVCLWAATLCLPPAFAW